MLRAIGPDGVARELRRVAIRQSQAGQAAQPEQAVLPHLIMPTHHEVRPSDVFERRLQYAGTVLLVSHDRDFLDRVVTSTIASEGRGRWVEYAGGYTDMLAQRVAAQRSSPAAVVGRAKAPPSKRSEHQPASRPRRMNFNDQRALERLPNQIATLQAQFATFNVVLADQDLYTRDPARFVTTTEALATARAELAAAEETWLRLEMLREEIELQR
jgi:ATP-binding cassette subfamily F protein uup